MSMKHNILVIFAALIIGSASATTVITGDGNLPFSFTVPVTAALLDKASGNFYVGLAAGGAYSLGYALRNAPFSSPSFKPITSQTITLGASPVEMLALNTYYGNTNPNLAFVLQKNSSPTRQSVVKIINNSGSLAYQSASLLDGSGALNQNGTVTSGIVDIASSAHYIFAAVRPGSAPTNFGQPNSGIAVVGVNKKNLALTQTAAQPFDTGIKAALLDATTSFAGSPSPIIANQATLFWDDYLHRLYVGLIVTTGGTAGDTANSVVVGSIFDGTLTLENFLPSSALVAGNTTYITSVEQAASSETVNVNFLQTLHASTGPSYLIINGGNGPQGTVTNTIFALPLVDVGDSENATQGLLADKTMFNTTTHRFETPVSSTAGLTTSNDAAAQVGAGPLPILDTVAISGLWVAGDTVYVSMGYPANTMNDTGIFYSQALFDNTGQIIRWTPWSKRVTPFNSFPDADPIGQIAFFGVDANNGATWMVNDTNNQTVRVTTWDEGTASSLAATLNQTFTKGCYSVLDLDQSTRGFGSITSRYALFGGAGIVAFAQISQAFTPSPSGPQEVTLDFSEPENYYVTALPRPAGAITALEYARQLTGSASNYFFAGTDVGLYAFANANGSGFDVTALSNINAAPFTTGMWQKINSIAGSIIDIKTTGNALYIMTSAPSAQLPYNYRIYSVPFATTLSAMFGAPTLIAQSQEGALQSTLAFYSMQIISTASDGSTEQLVISTNNGLYQSSAAGGVQNATNPTAANWQLISSSGTQLFNGSDYIDNATIPAVPPSTIWPFNLTDPSGFQIYDGGAINQVAGSSSNANPFALVPASFMNASNSSAFSSTNGPIIYFWSDGARRFFITQNTANFNKRVTAQNNLVVLPFDAHAWGAPSVDDQVVDNDTINSARSMYWIRTIGASGIILMGINSGVMALE